jgi:hypothetical protein
MDIHMNTLILVGNLVFHSLNILLLVTPLKYYLLCIDLVV